MTPPPTVAGTLEPAEDFPHLMPCPNVRCREMTVDALAIGPTRNTPVNLNLHYASWENGGRYKVITLRNHLGVTTVRKLMHAGQAFSGGLLQDHRETCKGGTGKRTKSREADG